MKPATSDDDGTPSRSQPNKKRKLEDSTLDGSLSAGISCLPNSSNSFYWFPSAGISAKRFASAQPLACRELNPSLHSPGRVSSTQFSEDGSFFLSCGSDGRVLLWPTNEVIYGREGIAPKIQEMETKHEQNSIECLALSPDNERIFSGGDDKNLFVHDAIT